MDIILIISLFNLSECPEGTFSAVVSNGPCETCPANSEGTGTGLTLCPCLQNYYRAPNEEPSLPCTRECLNLYIIQVEKIISMK